MFGFRVYHYTLIYTHNPVLMIQATTLHPKPRAPTLKLHPKPKALEPEP